MPQIDITISDVALQRLSDAFDGLTGADLKEEVKNTIKREVMKRESRKAKQALIDSRIQFDFDAV